MEGTKATHNEQVSQTLYIYEDEDTGIKYIYNGERLVPINAPQDPGEPGDPGIPKLDKFDKEELERQDEERQKQIEKEIEEYGDAVETGGPDSKEAKSRLEEISDLLNDSATARNLLDETERIVRKDYQKRNKEKKEAENAAKRYTAYNGIDNFIKDLNKLIAKEVKKKQQDDWSKVNKKFSRSGIIKPGRATKKNPVIPRLFVYYDRSGSWGYDDTKVGDAAISTLNVFVKKKQLKIEVYYFGNYVSTNPNDHGGGTGAGSDSSNMSIQRHIKENKPDNVVIMTDSDLSGPTVNVEVPGGMFLLFRRGDVDRWLVDNFRGKRLTKVYSF